MSQYMAILRTGANIQPVFSRQDSICSLHSPERSQYKACILQKGTNIRPGLSKQEPVYSLHCPDSSHLEPLLPLSLIRNSRARKTTFQRIKPSSSFSRCSLDFLHLAHTLPSVIERWNSLSANSFIVGRQPLTTQYCVTCSLQRL